MKPTHDDKRTDGLTLEEAMHLQAMESNPLTQDEAAMFRMFDREGWSQERRLAHILERAEALRPLPAAE